MEGLLRFPRIFYEFLLTFKIAWRLRGKKIIKLLVFSVFFQLKKIILKKSKEKERARGKEIIVLYCVAIKFIYLSSLLLKKIREITPPERLLVTSIE